MLLKHFVFLIVAIIWIADAARILGIFPYPSYSHQMVFRTLSIELARRGHELTIFTPNPMNDPTLKNYTEVDLHHLYDSCNIDFYSKISLGPWSFLSDTYNLFSKLSDQTLSHPAMQQLLSPNNTKKFDLIIIQCLYVDALYAISYRLNAPLIGVITNPPMAIHQYIFGNPLSAAHVPDMLSGLDDNMNIWERFRNVYFYVRQIIEYQTLVIPSQDILRKKYFGDSVPPAYQLSSKFSLMLTNAHPFFFYPRANVPEMVYMGGCQLALQKKQLPQDLKNILNNAKQGYIYFSLGSNIKSNLLPTERRDMLLRTFAELPYTVLWKFESDDLVDKPDNVIIRKWLPQKEVLAHPNIRLFIYQGGLQSTEEVIENAVPVISFPIFSDQLFNMKKMQSFGVGKWLEFPNLSRETLKETILEVITNSSYKENMVKLRNLLRDLPRKPIDNAIWWVEHVIRHKGALHLRTKSRDMPWYQVQLLDIMAIILAIIILAIYIIIIIKRHVFKMSKQLILKIKSKILNNVKKQQ